MPAADVVVDQPLPPQALAAAVEVVAYGVAAIFLALSLLGLAARRGADGARIALTVAAYLLAFCFVGNPRINDYWGLLYVGLLPFGFVQMPIALRDLIRSATK